MKLFKHISTPNKKFQITTGLKSYALSVELGQLLLNDNFVQGRLFFSLCIYVSLNRVARKPGWLHTHNVAEIDMNICPPLSTCWDDSYGTSHPADS